MPITTSPSGYTIYEGESILILQLVIVKQALKLEQIGIRFGGKSIRRCWAIRLGLKPGAKHQKVIDLIETILIKAAE